MKHQPVMETMETSGGRSERRQRINEQEDKL